MPNTPTLIALLGALFAGCGGGGTVAAGTGTPLRLALPSDDGRLVTVPLADARATVLDFFGPTCAPCKDKVPALAARRDDLTARGARLVLVAVLARNESTADARQALRSWGVDAPFLVDREDASLREFGVRDLPATVILSAGGAVIWKAPAGATADDVVDALP